MSESPDDDQDSMSDEFDTVAAWTADVAAGMDESVRIPAGCRGSGSPGALHWLLNHLRPDPGQVFLDCGAGIGGPAAFAASETGARPLLTEPEPGACRAARSLFGLPVVQAGTELPIASGSVGVGWSLGVLCTVDDQPRYLAEIRRVLSSDARFGFIVYCAAHAGALRLPQPEGNDFPTEDALEAMLTGAALTVTASGWTDQFAAFPPEWERAMAEVEDELKRRYGTDRRWQAAQEQSDRVGTLLAAREVRGRMLVVSPT